MVWAICILANDNGSFISHILNSTPYKSSRRLYRGKNHTFNV
uniref:Uncharacterized protein n=1 Tax=Lepeophtheirus salmonis TaxID=72036 RepID=A0A0K2V007_LEPSM